MFPEESDKIERYVSDLPDMIHGSVVASRPKTMQEAIEIETELMDKKIQHWQNLAAGSGEKKPYGGSKPLCSKCNYHHDGQKPTCYECGAQGHFKRDCPKLKNNNGGNQEAKNAGLAKELESLRVQFSDLQVSNNQLSQQAFADVVSAGLVTGMSKGLKHGIEHGKAGRDLAAVKAYDPEADSKYVKALQDLKDLKYPLVDQLEILKDAPMELIMASLHLESDSEGECPLWIYPWAFKEEMMLEDAIAANISRAKKKKKYRWFSQHHRDWFRSSLQIRRHPRIRAYHRSRGLAILLADAATQTEVADKEDEPHPRLHRSISLPPFIIWNGKVAPVVLNNIF
ncbi:gypsy type transposase [Tanacetum coccineum]